MGRASRYSAEVRERSVRLVAEQQQAHGSEWSALTSIASKIGCTAETLRRWVRQAERDEGKTIIGLYKTEVVRHRGPWRNIDAVEYATLEWVDWFNNRRLLEPLGDVPSIEFEQSVLS